jgi:hypothetical protein
LKYPVRFARVRKPEFNRIRVGEAKKQVSVLAQISLVPSSPFFAVASLTAVFIASADTVRERIVDRPDVNLDNDMDDAVTAGHQPLLPPLGQPERPTTTGTRSVGATS